MDTNKIIFDKLDKKCIQELQLLINIISSTYNKLKILFDGYYDELYDILFKSLKKKKWTLSDKEYKNIFYPFTEDYSNQTKITSLKNYFYMESTFDIYKGNYYEKKKLF